MKLQWRVILAVLFALIIAAFAVDNVRKTPISYVFGTATLPLVYIIIGSALFGCLIVGILGTPVQIRLVRESRRLRRRVAEVETLLVQLKAKQESVMDAAQKSQSDTTTT